MRAAMIDALAPLRKSMPKVREQEILRVAVNLPSRSGAATITEARQQVLAWAQRRSGGRLPKKAWDGAGFDYLAGGRTTLAIRFSVDRTEIWTLRADDPDKTVAGRVWTTESLKKNALSPRNRPGKTNVFRGHSFSSAIDFQALRSPSARP